MPHVFLVKDEVSSLKGKQKQVKAALSPLGGWQEGGANSAQTPGSVPAQRDLSALGDQASCCAVNWVGQEAQTLPGDGPPILLVLMGLLVNVEMQ